MWQVKPIYTIPLYILFFSDSVSQFIYRSSLPVQQEKKTIPATDTKKYYYKAAMFWRLFTLFVGLAASVAVVPEEEYFMASTLAFSPNGPGATSQITLIIKPTISVET